MEASIPRAYSSSLSHCISRMRYQDAPFVEEKSASSADLDHPPTPEAWIEEKKTMF
jgi:hypothetical protein